jgi:hypothetical protein
VSPILNRPANSNRILRLERDARRVHNGRCTRDDGKLDGRIVELVKLLARRAAEKDLRDGRDEQQRSDEQSEQ